MTCDIGTDIERAAALIADGGLVAFPTETVYGLGANAFDTQAVARLFEAKGRPRFDPLIVHVADTDDVRPLVSSPLSDVTTTLMEKLWPGPLTLVLPKTDDVPDLVTAGMPTVAVRVPGHSMARDLISRSSVPIAAPSANRFGRISPTTAVHVAEQLGDRIDYILDSGPCRVGVESTVLSMIDERAMLLRPGGVSLEELEALIGRVDVQEPTSNPGECPQSSPGMLDRHYAPRTPLTIIDELPSDTDFRDAGLMTLTRVEKAERFAVAEVLSANGNLTEAAAQFYAALRRLDDSGVSRLFAIPFSSEGLGLALNDRLRRAATR